MTLQEQHFNCYHLVTSLERALKLAESQLDAVKEKMASCTHPVTRVEEEVDYHNNTDWLCTYCVDCGKLLEKK